MFGIATRQWDGQLRDCGLIPNKLRDYPLLQSIQTGFESDPACCSRKLGAISLEVMQLGHEDGH